MHKGGVMRYVYAVFTSRNETLSFASQLKKMGIPCVVTSTPKSAGRACGISVRFMNDYLQIAKSSLGFSYKTFKGFYEA